MTTATVAVTRQGFLVGMCLAGAGAVLFSAKAIVAKLTYRYGVDAVTLLAFRMLFSLPVFAAIALFERRRAIARHQQLTRKQAVQVVVLGLLGYYLSSFLDFLGLQYITASLERLILFLSPTLVLLLSAWWLKKPITRGQWMALGLSYAGVVLVLGHDLAHGGTHVALGSALVFGAALTYAIYLIQSGELLRQIGSTRLVAYAMTVSAIASVSQFLLLRPVSELFNQPMEVYGWSLVNASLCTVFPVFLTMWAVARIGAPGTAQVSMLGPVATLFLAAWLLGEPITAWQLAGTALVLSGMVVLGTRKR